MTFNPAEKWRAELLEISRRLVDGESTESDPKRLAEILDSSDEAKELYLSYMEIDTLIAIRSGSGALGSTAAFSTSSEFAAEEFEDAVNEDAVNVADPPPTHQPTEKPHWLVKGSRHVLAATVVFVCGFLASSIWQASVLSEAEIADRHNLKSKADSLAADPYSTLENDHQGSSFFRTELVSNVIRDAAIVVRSEQTHGEPLCAGTRLRPGRIKIETGTLQLEFLGGAILALAAPAELEIVSSDCATLHSGSVRVAIPERAQRFILNAAMTAIADVGTQFSVNVSQDGKAEVKVLDGEVELSLLGDDGTTVLNRTIGIEATYLVEPETGSMAPSLENKTPSSPPIELRNDEPLVVPKEYADAVLSQNPALFWRFSPSESDTIDSETGIQSGGRLFGDTSQIRRRTGDIEFDRGETRYLRTDSPLKNINEASYSIEFWINPDDLQHATCVGLCPVGDESDLLHLNVVEIASDTFLVHEPGAFRFLHRVPPGREASIGFNLLTKGICTPGKWQHVVVIKRDHQLELYWNGVLAKRAAAKEVDCEGDFHLYVGQLKPSTNERQVAGRMDEIAVYPHALSGDEVRSHYELMLDHNPMLLN